MGQTRPQDEIVVVAQRNYAEVEALIALYPSLPITLTTSSRGAAHGRNVGVSTLSPSERILLFPNDSTWYPQGMVDEIRNCIDLSSFRVGAMTVVDDFGPKLNVPDPGTKLTPILTWRVIEMGLLIKQSTFSTVGGFEASIGTGAPTPWQSGESTEIVLRALRRWPTLRNEFVWLPRDVWVGGVPDTSGLSVKEKRQKLRAYGRGAGKVGRDYRFPLLWKVRLVVGGLTLGLRNRQYRPLDGLWAFTGRLEGFLGRTFGGANQTAVRR